MLNDDDIDRPLGNPHGGEDTMKPLHNFGSRHTATRDYSGIVSKRVYDELNPRVSTVSPGHNSRVQRSKLVEDSVLLNNATLSRSMSSTNPVMINDDDSNNIIVSNLVGKQKDNAPVQEAVSEVDVASTDSPVTCAHYPSTLRNKMGSEDDVEVAAIDETSDKDKTMIMDITESITVVPPVST